MCNRKVPRKIQTEKYGLVFQLEECNPSFPVMKFGLETGESPDSLLLHLECTSCLEEEYSCAYWGCDLNLAAFKNGSLVVVLMQSCCV